MKQRVVVKNQERYIYFIEEANLGFYLIIPNHQEVSLMIQLLKVVQDEIVAELPLFMDKAVIVPVLSEQVWSGISQRVSSYYDSLDQILSQLLNFSHKILTYNHVTVNNQVFFKSTLECSDFSTWFAQKYNGRVQLLELDTLSTKEVDNLPSQVEVPLEKKSEESSEEVMNDSLVEELKKENTKEVGFVSYVLLGVLVAVISLVFLYLII